MKDLIRRITILFIVIIVLVTSSNVFAESKTSQFDMRYWPNADNTLSVVGLATDNIGEEITITISTGEFIVVNGQKEYKWYILSETKALVNKKGYFSLNTPPINKADVKDNSISVSLTNKEGKEASNSPAYPMHIPDISDYSDYYELPAYFLRSDYESYKDDSDLRDPLSAIEMEAYWKETKQLSRKIAAGQTNSYAIDSSGQLWAWGVLSPQLCGPSAVMGQNCIWRMPNKIVSIPDAEQVTANSSTGAVLTKSGVIFGWGASGTNKSPYKIGKFANAVQIQAASNGDGLILTKDGSVWSWKANLPAASDKPIPAELQINLKKIDLLKNITQIHIGNSNFYGDNYMALEDNGRVWAWGDMNVILSSTKTDNYKTFPLSVPIKTVTPQVLTGLPPIKDITQIEGTPAFISKSFEFWSYLISDNHVHVLKPGKVADGVISFFQDSKSVIKNDGKFYNWHKNKAIIYEKPNDQLMGIRVISPSTGGTYHTIGIADNGQITGWGNNAFGQLGVSAVDPILLKEIALATIKDPLIISASDRNALVLSKDGTIYGWGNNEHHEINDSGKSQVLSPYKIGQFSNVKKVAAGDRFSLYLTKTGELYGWGDLSWLGVRRVSAVPFKLTSISEDISDIQVYERTVAVLTRSGNVYQLGGVAWGEEYALLHNHFQKIDNTSNIKAIAIGRNRAYALKNDGTVWWWTTKMVETKTKSKTIYPVAGFKDIVSLDASCTNDDYIVAIDKNNQVWGSGNNTARQLGYSFSNSDTPVNLTKEIKTSDYMRGSGMYKFKSIHADKWGVLFITENNKVVLLGSSTYRSKNADESISYVELHNNNAFWIRNNQLWVRGIDNDNGQLGIGVKDEYYLPQKVISKTGGYIFAKK